MVFATNGAGIIEHQYERNLGTVLTPFTKINSKWILNLSVKCKTIKIWFWKRLLSVPWTARRSNQSILKEINAEYSKSRLTGKDPEARKDWRQEEKGMTEGEMAGWHHRLNGHESEQAPGDSEGQGSTACCILWRHRIGHNWATEQDSFIMTTKCPLSTP